MSTGDQIAFSGSDTQLQPATAQTLALALHELVTNSAKYGALSTLSGRLSHPMGDPGRYAADDRGRNATDRRSSKPTSRGFGTRSVIASIESQLGGQAEFDWRSEGLICRLSVPARPAFDRTAQAPRTTMPRQAACARMQSARDQ